MFSNLLPSLAAKILAGALAVSTVALAATLTFVVITKNAVISHQDKAINDPKTGYIAQVARLSTDNTILLGNQTTLKSAVNACSAGVAAQADAVNRVNEAGAAAVAAVRQAGAGLASRLERINSAPAATCADAGSILAGEADQ